MPKQYQRHGSVSMLSAAAARMPTHAILHGASLRVTGTLMQPCTSCVSVRSSACTLLAASLRPACPLSSCPNAAFLHASHVWFLAGDHSIKVQQKRTLHCCSWVPADQLSRSVHWCQRLETTWTALLPFMHMPVHMLVHMHSCSNLCHNMWWLHPAACSARRTRLHPPC